MAITPTELATRAGISVPYASQLLNRKRLTPSLELALQIYDRTGQRFGRLEGRTQEEIEELRAAAELIGKAA